MTATSVARVKLAATASSTRSSAAADGSEASGIASNVRYGIPADPKTSAAAYKYGSGCLKTIAVRSSGTSSPTRTSAFNRRATETSSSSRSRWIQKGLGVGDWGLGGLVTGDWLSWP